MLNNIRRDVGTRRVRWVRDYYYVVIDEPAEVQGTDSIGYQGGQNIHVYKLFPFRDFKTFPELDYNPTTEFGRV